jgi:FAD/FMN-containing dehydrogenase
VKAKTVDGQEIELGSQIASLRTRLRGPVIAPGDVGFEDSRTVWNSMIDRHPALVVRCLGTADVIECVRFARDTNVLLSIKGGGHNIAGLACANGAMMLDMSLMRGVWVDSARRIAHAQAGCTLGDVDRETQLHGLAAVLGFVSLTGIAGLTLGGGVGYLTRRFGWTSDNVAAMQVVTADAQLVRASDDENADLLWGLRGGGGNFGVVTGIDYRLYPVGPEIVGGVVAWPASEAKAVLDLYREVAAQAPRELTVVALLRPAPPAPWLPVEWHGKPIAAILACHTGPPERAEQAVAAIKSMGSPIGDVLVRRPYVQMQSLLDATQPKGRRYYWKSEYLPGIEPALCEKVIVHAADFRSPHSAIILFQMDGALNDIRADHSAVGNRDARFMLNIASSWERPDDDAANIDWTRTAWRDMQRFSTGGTYVNFLTEDDGQDRVQAALGGAIPRLAQIKARWDSQNMFRTNRNIAPG